MYRRIKLITHLNCNELIGKTLDIKGGIMLVPVKEGIYEVWSDMPMPRKRIQKNCRFYITEEGWNIYGRKIIKACQRLGQDYRVIRIKENSVEVVYKDEIQVVVRPLRKRA